MKKYAVSLIFLFSLHIVVAQDIILTLSAEIDQEKTSLDSILVENISNGTDTIYSNLPENDFYRINLTNYNLLGAYDWDFNQSSGSFSIMRNLPGNIVLEYRGSSASEFILTVFNINGQIVYSSGKQNINWGKSVQLNVNSTGMFLVKTETETDIQAFKVVGIGKGNNYSLNFSEEFTRALDIKSNISNNENDFHFSSGDSIKISVYKQGYSATAQQYKITQSMETVFPLSEIQLTGILVDSRDNHEYKTIIINEKEYMAENMAYLPVVSPASSDSYTEPMYYVYGYYGTDVDSAKNTDIFKTYGVLYNLYAIDSVCPAGWHVISDMEWTDLAQYIDSQSENEGRQGYTWLTVGKHLKATGTIQDGNGLWRNDIPGNLGTDDYDFSALPGGKREIDGTFKGMGENTYFWLRKWGYYISWSGKQLNYNSASLMQPTVQGTTGFSVRCIKD